MVTGWEHIDWHTRGWYHAVLRFLVAYSVLLISRTLEVLFQSSFIEKEARVTNAVLYFSGFLLFVVKLLGTLVRRWQLAPAFRLVDQLVFIRTGRFCPPKGRNTAPGADATFSTCQRSFAFQGAAASRYASVSHQVGFPVILPLTESSDFLRVWESTSGSKKYSRVLCQSSRRGRRPF